MSFVHRVDELVAEHGNGLTEKAKHWERVPLGWAAQVVNGYPFPSKGFSKEGGEPVVRIRDILPGKAGTRYLGEHQGAPVLEQGELVIGMDGDFNSRLWPGGTALINQRVCKVVPNGRVYSKDFLAYVLPGYLKLINDHTSAVTVKHLSSQTIQEIPLPFPPRLEQDRLVSKLDELFSRISEGERALEKVQKLVERYRQSVLKAAVAGALTRAWREKNKDKLESGDALLARILKARREAWEQAELEKMRAKGVKPKNDDWKKKYKEPVAPDTSDLPKLPEGWVWASMDQLLSKIEAGKSFKCEERPPKLGETGVVKVSAVSWGDYDENESKTVTDESKISPRYFIKTGDFLFSRANTIDLVGACVIVHETNGRVQLSDKILRFDFVFDLRRWVDLVLKSAVGRRQIELLATGNQESMRNIGQQRIGRIAVPIPSELEIPVAVDQFTRIVEQSNALKRTAESEVGRATKLRQATLKCAFAGELVPQDPTDEPASILLERIAVERENASVATRNQTRRKKAIAKARTASGRK